jgi:methylated-DNA-protein-cysteine methyltransferase-like protein
MNSAQKSEYQGRFFLVIRMIPVGKVVTYGQVAQMAGYPTLSRAVGRCLKLLPEGSNLPWHRVINAKGELSFPNDSYAYLHQRSLLEAEGVEFIANKVPLRLFRWTP